MLAHVPSRAEIGMQPYTDDSLPMAYAMTSCCCSACKSKEVRHAAAWLELQKRAAAPKLGNTGLIASKVFDRQTYTISAFAD